MLKIRFSFFFVMIVIAIACVGCNNNSFEVDVSDVEVSAKLDVVHLEFFESDSTEFPAKLEEMREQFPYFYASGTDRFWQTQFNDQAQQKLIKDVNKVFPTFYGIRKELKNLYQHFHYYFDDARQVTTVAYFSNLDFEYPILVADTFVFVALDMYLGSTHPAYSELPEYLAFERDKRYIMRDIAQELSTFYISETSPDAPFISEIIYQGLIHYFIKSMIPDISEADLFKYTEKEIEFCNNNERMVWSYFIDNELIFDTSLDPKRRFVYPAPFSKFRTSFDADTPGQIGKWIGYQIVKAYAANNNLTLKELLQPQEGALFLKKSKYKPK